MGKKRMKTHCIYHHADYDGLLSAAVVLHFIPDAVLHGWDYNEPTPVIPDDCETLYIVDLSVPDLMNDPRLIWIDHHKSAIEKWDNAVSHFTGKIIPGIRIDGVAACRLCWHYFNDPQHETHMLGGSGLSAEYYQKRLPLGDAPEPLVLVLAGEYDVWQEEGNPEWDKCVALQHGLRLFSNDPATLSRGLLMHSDYGGVAVPSEAFLESLIEQGRVVERYTAEQNESICRNNTYIRDWEGLTFLVLNSARGNSRSFPKIDKMWPACGPNDVQTGAQYSWDDIDALCMWKYTGEKVTVSLYHHPNHKDLDLSVIAVKYGGGGHRGACGFQMSLEDFSKVLA